MSNIKIEKKNDFRIEYTKGDTFALKLTFKNITQDLTSAIFTVKENQDDATPLIEKTINAGITKLEENFYKKELVYKLQLQATDSQFLEADHLYLYDLKIAVGNVIKTVIKGNFVVTYNVTGVDRITTELAEIEIDDAIDTDAETTPATHGIEYETDPVATAKIGDMSTLSTTAKDTLVNAINEIVPKANTALEEITKIENGTVTVPSANEAETANIALYASDDTTKGTIEERLTNLGFKQGVVEDLVATASTNILKRQGKYVIGELAFDGVSGTYGGNVNLGTLPADFRPKENLTIKASANSYIAVNMPQTTTIGCQFTVNINTDGTIVLTFVGSVQSLLISELRIYFAHETN